MSDLIDPFTDAPDSAGAYQARLRAEIDRLSRQASKLEQENENLRARIETLEAALKPFANLRIHDAAPDDGLVIVTDAAGGIVDTGSNRMKVSDIRNAMRAHQQRMDAKS